MALARGPGVSEDDFVTTGSLTIERGMDGWRWRREDLEPVAALGYVDAVRAELLTKIVESLEPDDDD